MPIINPKIHTLFNHNNIQTPQSRSEIENRISKSIEWFKEVDDDFRDIADTLEAIESLRLPVIPEIRKVMMDTEISYDFDGGFSFHKGDVKFKYLTIYSDVILDVFGNNDHIYKIIRINDYIVDGDMYMLMMDRFIGHKNTYLEILESFIEHLKVFIPIMKKFLLSIDPNNH